MNKKNSRNFSIALLNIENLRCDIGVSERGMVPKAIGVGVPPSDIIEFAVSGRGGRATEPGVDGGNMGDIGGESMLGAIGDGAGE